MRIAINGYGRIGRQILRAIYEYGLQDTLQVVAINGSGGVEVNALLTKRDTVHGIFGRRVEHDAESLIIDGRKIPFLDRLPIEQCKWGDHGVDLVMECTGDNVSAEKCQTHLKNGAKKVLISAPAKGEVDATVVYGVNHGVLTEGMRIVSNASCTTNCLAPAAKVLVDAFGVEKGLMTTVHAFTNDQTLIDVRHKDLRRARSGAQNIIPTKTGAAKAVGLVLPQLKGKMDGFAVRVPVINVSMVDLTFVPSRPISVEAINDAMKAASQSGPLAGVLAYSDEPLVSTDFNHTPYGSIFDATQTRVIGDGMAKILAWYDNEWGFSCQMLNTARAMFGMDFKPVALGVGLA